MTLHLCFGSYQGKEQTLFILHLADKYDINSNLLHPSNTMMSFMSIESFTLLTEFVQMWTQIDYDQHAVSTPANVNVIPEVITAGE